MLPSRSTINPQTPMVIKPGVLAPLLHRNTRMVLICRAAGVDLFGVVLLQNTDDKKLQPRPV